jgi:hypothetical protein
MEKLLAELSFDASDRGDKPWSSIAITCAANSRTSSRIGTCPATSLGGEMDFSRLTEIIEDGLPFNKWLASRCGRLGERA